MKGKSVFMLWKVENRLQWLGGTVTKFYPKKKDNYYYDVLWEDGDTTGAHFPQKQYLKSIDAPNVGSDA